VGAPLARGGLMKVRRARSVSRNFSALKRSSFVDPTCPPSDSRSVFLVARRGRAAGYEADAGPLRFLLTRVQVFVRRGGVPSAWWRFSGAVLRTGILTTAADASAGFREVERFRGIAFREKQMNATRRIGNETFDPQELPFSVLRGCA
jgi:hypothetical protein